MKLLLCFFFSSNCEFSLFKKKKIILIFLNSHKMEPPSPTNSTTSTVSLKETETDIFLPQSPSGTTAEETIEMISAENKEGREKFLNSFCEYVTAVNVENANKDALLAAKDHEIDLLLDQLKETTEELNNVRNMFNAKIGNNAKYDVMIKENFRRFIESTSNIVHDATVFLQATQAVAEGKNIVAAGIHTIDLSNSENGDEQEGADQTVDDEQAEIENGGGNETDEMVVDETTEPIADGDGDNETSLYESFENPKEESDKINDEPIADETETGMEPITDENETTMVKVFICPFCSDQFTKKSLLREHKMVVHKIFKKKARKIGLVGFVSTQKKKQRKILHEVA